jgi:Ca-activated chloride channel family protein
MRLAILGCLLAAGCAGQTVVHPVVASSTTTTATAKPDAPKDDPVVQPDLPHPAKNATWIGASAESEALLVGTSETSVGVWIDAPVERPKTRVPVDLALVVDTSGSMAGAKMDNAKAAAKQIVDSLADGDIVSIDAFDNDARPIAEPTVLTAATRPIVLQKIAMLRPSGSTNMFDGLSLAEMHASRAPQTHGVRRVVVISDGIANVGPSSPDALGALAEKGLRFRTQVTSLGVGTDYDERTLNALAQRTSGRLYHLSEPKEMASMLKREVDLLTSTVASDAFVELVAAPGVTFTATEGARGEWISAGTSMKIPLGTIFAGQHREVLIRARVTPGTTASSLASVRLHFKDPDEGDLERVQEVVARVRFTNDEKEVFTAQSARTRSIMAIMDAAKVEMQAAQAVSSGQIAAADADLARAQTALEKKAKEISDDKQRARVMAQAQSISTARAAMPKPSAPPAAMRDSALKMNQAGMAAEGF